MGVVLDVDGLAVGHGGEPLLTGVSLQVSAGEVLCVLGPNGAGKTTLFRSLLGFLPALGGRVVIAGAELRSWGRRDLARHTAYVPQAQSAPFPFTVTEVVLMGRTPHIGLTGTPGRADRAAAGAALDRLGIGHLAGREFGRISGGERQLVVIARALAQQPELLMMDEPTANLDLGNQTTVLQTVRELAGDGLAIVMISHTPDHAFTLDGTAALLHPDRTLSIGPARDVVTGPALTAAYRREVVVLTGTAPDGRTLRACVPVL